jgi:hypothetical protein
VRQTSIASASSSASSCESAATGRGELTITSWAPLAASAVKMCSLASRATTKESRSSAG